MKLFISYARVDKPLCLQIVEKLSTIHEVWYDRRIHIGMEWWDEIQEKLDWCEGLVYLMSPESVASDYCQKEFAIAAEARKHIFPVLIQARTVIPDSLSHIHYADLSQGMEDIITLMNALTVAERRGRRANQPVIKQPIKPEEPPKSVSPAKAIGQAADAMEAENFDSAVFVIKQALQKKPSGRIERILRNMLAEAETALERQTYLREAAREYAPILELVQRSATQVIGCEEFAEFQQDFPDYDPENISDICKDASHSDPVGTMPALPGKRSSFHIFPQPFKWIDIPNKDYRITKYPITNAQYAKFIEAGGYKNKDWWTDEGWTVRTEENWKEPRYWTEHKWNGDLQPVIGISWFEAIAFCLWLSDVANETILLPTVAQWQYAARGDSNRKYSWGNRWNCNMCNCSVLPCLSVGTTSVNHYENEDVSLFGVVDMIGNVMEWCLTDYDDHSNNSHASANARVLMGGTWITSTQSNFDVNRLDRGSPNARNNIVGFRVVRN